MGKFGSRTTSEVFAVNQEKMHLSLIIVGVENNMILPPMKKTTSKKPCESIAHVFEVTPFSESIQDLSSCVNLVLALSLIMVSVAPFPK